MSILDEIGHHQAARLESTETKAEALIGGEEVTIESSQTEETIGDNHWLRVNERGVPRDFDVIRARRLGRSTPMQIVKAAVFDSVTGGEVRMIPWGQEKLNDREQELATFMRDLVLSEHHGKYDFDDIIVMAINDMLDMGQSFNEMLGVEGNADIPVARLKAIDALTVQKNVDKSGEFQDPAYYQLPYKSGSGVISSMEGDPNSLSEGDVMVMHWPKGARSSSHYPVPPVIQADTMIEVIENSMTHLNREYADNQMGAGFLWGQGTNKDANVIEKEFKKVAGDPNSFPVFTGEGDLQWKTMSGDAISLDAVKEEEWFLRLCGALVGVSPQELGLIKDVNRSTAQQQGSQMFKRLVQPITETVCKAVTNQWFKQFDLYNEMGQPFRMDIVHSDPEQERREEKDSRERYAEGVTTLNEHRATIGLNPIETVVTMPDGREIAIGDLPRTHAEKILASGDITEGEAVE